MNIRYMIEKNEMPASAAEAPYIGRAIANGVRNRALMVANLVAVHHVSETTVKSVIDAAIEETAELCCAGRDVDWGAFRAIAKMHGSFPCEDSAFADAANAENPPRVDVNAEATNATRELLRDVIPTKVSLAEMLSDTRVSNIMDVATEMFATVIGTTPFLVLGNSLTLDGDGEYVKAHSKRTGALAGTATVVSVSKGQRAKCQFQTALAPGEYALEIATCGLAGETTPRIFRKGVTVLAGETPPTPTITGVHQDGRPDNTVLLGPDPWTVNGTGLARQTGDEVWVELYSASDPTERIDEGDNTSLVTSWTDTAITISRVKTNTRQPDGSWWEAYPRSMVVFIRGGVRHEFPMTFVGG